MKDGVKYGLQKLGYRLVPERVIQQYSERSNDPYLSVYDRADRIANPANDRAGDDFSKERRFYTLYQGAQQILKNNVSGDFAECGSKHGHSAYILADIIKSSSQVARKLWIFDSFEGGLSDKTDKDRSTDLGDTTVRKTKNQKDRFSSSYDHVKNLFKDMGFVEIIKGWIPQSLDCAAKERRYALAHIDVDLYEPTKAAIEFFYDRMDEGAMIIVDDYGSKTFPGCQSAVDEFLETHTHSFFLVSHTLGCVIIK